MELSAFNDYLETRYYDQLKYYEKASGKNQRRYKNFQWILIVVSTLTTIFAATNEFAGFDLHYLIVVSSAVVTVLTAALKTFQYQELWVNYRNTIEQLKPEIFYYRYNVGDYGNPEVDKEILFISRIESILSKEHDSWPVKSKITDISTDNSEKVNE